MNNSTLKKTPQFGLNYTWINFVVCILILTTWIGCKKESEVTSSNSPQKPNVVLILTDDQGWGDFAYTGNTNVSTPNIDALAESGTSFENFYVQPVCSPTRAELLTGRYYPRTGVYSTSAGGERINLDETTIADVFKKAGYHTAAYGKWHNGMQPPYHPNSRGFDDFYGFASGHWGNYFSPMLEHNGQVVEGNGYLPDDLTNRGLDFIKEHRDEPFFLYLPFNTPHSPMQVPDAYFKKFEGKELNMRYQGKESEDLAFTRAALAMVENIDYNVGRIDKAIKDLGLAENTVVVYLSDNGPNNWRWNGGMRGKKASVDEGGVRTPFFIRWKNSIPQGKKVVTMASSIDLLPTLASLAGIPLPETKPLDGKDLMPLIFGESKDWKERLIFNYWSGKTSVRSQEYRLDAENNLYDMEKDRGQKTDLSQVFPEIRDSLVRAKKNWQEKVLSEKSKNENRPFTLGAPASEYTQLPARDGISHGSIKRSNRFPNDSFFTNWSNTNDSITWDVDVLKEGTFEVQLYYTVSEENLGASVQLSFKNEKIAAEITEVNNPPLEGMEHDRVPRVESYVKDFKPMNLGNIHLEKGQGTLTIKALNIPGKEAADLRLLLFKRIE